MGKITHFSRSFLHTYDALLYLRKQSWIYVFTTFITFCYGKDKNYVLELYRIRMYTYYIERQDTYSLSTMPLFIQDIGEVGWHHP